MSIKRQCGMTLIELVMAIVIIGVGVGGVMMAFSTVVKSSADPLVRKQMLAIAEEMVEEITLQQYTPTGVALVNSARICTSGNGVAPRSAFNDVFDFNGYQTTGICNIDGDAITALSSYNVQVTVSSATTLGSGIYSIAGNCVAKITVTVTHGTDSLTLTGWRVNYTTNACP